MSVLLSGCVGKEIAPINHYQFEMEHKEAKCKKMEANRFIKWNQYWFHPVIISSSVFYVIVYLKFFYLSNQNIYLD